MEKYSSLQDSQKMVVSANLTDSFEIYSGVKHDRMLFPHIFTFVNDWMMREIKKVNRSIR